MRLIFSAIDARKNSVGSNHSLASLARRLLENFLSESSSGIQCCADSVRRLAGRERQRGQPLRVPPGFLLFHLLFLELLLELLRLLREAYEIRVLPLACELHALILRTLGRQKLAVFEASVKFGWASTLLLNSAIASLTFARSRAV
jgi:hypothetical protein